MERNYDFIKFTSKHFYFNQALKQSLKSQNKFRNFVLRGHLYLYFLI